MATSPEDEPLPEHYLVFVGATDRPAIDPIAVLARHDIHSYSLYRLSIWGFAAYITDNNVDRLRQDPDVLSVEQDTRARLAPHFRVEPERRVEGYYSVSVRRTSELEVVAARVGAEMDRVFTSIHAFAAYLTEEQVAALRRDPEVNDIEDDSHVYLDD